MPGWVTVAHTRRRGCSSSIIYRTRSSPGRWKEIRAKTGGGTYLFRLENDTSYMYLDFFPSLIH